MTEPAGDPRNPTDTPLGAVERNLRDEGFDGQFRAVADANLQCLTCGAEFPARGQRADRLTRLEGASDPADMVVVIPLRCPACQTAGTLVASYGPEATEAEADVLVALQREPAEGTEGPRGEATPGVR